ncbi:MAG: PhzF family phenazine biosynthesis protein [Alphaproteobacteria bacterium]
MKTYRFLQVDAFTTERFAGNPAAVVFDADDIPATSMQAIAREMNLSETVFVVRPTLPEADYRARIFTPRSEIPFAGHPTVATAFAMLEENRVKSRATPFTLMQECGIGVVPVETARDAEGWSFVMTQGAPKFTAIDLPLERRAQALQRSVADMVGTPACIVSTGLPWLVFGVATPQALAAAQPNHAIIEQIAPGHKIAGISVFSLGALAAGCTVKVRSFAPAEGVPEDPVCGSGNGCVAAYIAHHNLLGRPEFAYWSEQGTEMQRPGRVYAEATPVRDSHRIRIGGRAITALEGNFAV